MVVPGSFVYWYCFVLGKICWAIILVGHRMSCQGQEHNQARIALLKSAAAKGIMNIHDSTGIQLGNFPTQLFWVSI